MRPKKGKLYRVTGLETYDVKCVMLHNFVKVNTDRIVLLAPEDVLLCIVPYTKAHHKRYNGFHTGAACLLGEKLILVDPVFFNRVEEVSYGT